MQQYYTIFSGTRKFNEKNRDVGGTACKQEKREQRGTKTAFCTKPWGWLWFLYSSHYKSSERLHESWILLYLTAGMRSMEPFHKFYEKTISLWILFHRVLLISIQISSQRRRETEGTDEEKGQSLPRKYHINTAVPVGGIEPLRPD